MVLKVGFSYITYEYGVQYYVYLGAENKWQRLACGFTARGKLMISDSISDLYLEDMIIILARCNSLSLSLFLFGTNQNSAENWASLLTKIAMTLCPLPSTKKIRSSPYP